jgi:Rab family protein
MIKNNPNIIESSTAPNNLPNSILYKIILVGDMGVGKSSILSQYIKQIFPESPLPTIAIEFATKNIRLKEGGWVKAQIWDTAGQEKYKSITSHHYRKAVGALLVYDITRKSTFDDCFKWYNELKNYCEKDCVICLIGNKNDIKNREVSFEEGKNFSKKYKTIFFETSAKNKESVNDCFEELLQQIYNVKRRNNDVSNSIILKKAIIQKNNNNDGCC